LKRRYRRNPDPWNFATDPYEQERYSSLLALLSAATYTRALELGCSIGVMTEKSADRCDESVAVDFSETAAKQAKDRCARHSHVTVTCESILNFVPDGSFDLLVLSEIGYYFEEDVWREVSARLIAHVGTGGTIVAGHWLGVSNDHRLSGDQVHEVLKNNADITVVELVRYPLMRIDRMVKL
jgi:cyclopropane fatty-acyl-phospholipid synthase-like methyltransferase